MAGMTKSEFREAVSDLIHYVYSSMRDLDNTHFSKDDMEAGYFWAKMFPWVYSNVLEEIPSLPAREEAAKYKKAVADALAAKLARKTAASRVKFKPSVTGASVTPPAAVVPLLFKFVASHWKTSQEAWRDLRADDKSEAWDELDSMGTRDIVDALGGARRLGLSNSNLEPFARAVKRAAKSILATRSSTIY